MLLLAALAPSAFLLHFFWARDKYEREPLRRVLFVFLISLVSVIPAAIAESFFNLQAFGLIGLAVTVWLGVALPEELIKYLFLRWLAVGHHGFNEVYDGIIYGVAASLGFATAENLFYVFGSEGSGWTTAIMRAVLSVPAHTLWGVMIGYYAARARFEPDPRASARFLWTGLFQAIFWHGLYDFFAFGAEQVSAGLGILFVIGILVVVATNWAIGIRLVRLAQAQSVFKRPPPLLNPVAALRPDVHFCHNCGQPVPRASRFCTNCGYEFPAPAKDG
jgi:RsiW-degrading membrane proteinase PrsW (M82 family)